MNRIKTWFNNVTDPKKVSEYAFKAFTTVALVPIFIYVQLEQYFVRLSQADMSDVHDAGMTTLNKAPGFAAIDQWASQSAECIKSDADILQRVSADTRYGPDPKTPGYGKSRLGWL